MYQKTPIVLISLLLFSLSFVSALELKCDDDTYRGTCNSEGLYCGSQNMIKNSGFEMGSANFEKVGDSAKLDYSTYYAGEVSMKITSSDSSFGQNIDVIAGNKYNLIAYAYGYCHNAAFYHGVSTKLTEYSSAVYTEQWPWNNQNSWELLTLTFTPTVSETLRNLRVVCIDPEDTGYLYVDSMHMELLDEEAEPGLIDNCGVCGCDEGMLCGVEGICAEPAEQPPITLPVTAPETACPDFDGNTEVTKSDLDMFAEKFGLDSTSGYYEEMYDLNSDNMIDDDDRAILESMYGQTGLDCFKQPARIPSLTKPVAPRLTKPVAPPAQANPPDLSLLSADAQKADFNKDGCVDDNDKEFADREIRAWIDYAKGLPVQYKEPDCSRTKDVADEFCKRLLFKMNYGSVAANTFETKRSTQTAGVYLPSGNSVADVRSGYDYISVLECRYLVEGSGKFHFEKYGGPQLGDKGFVSACYQEVDVNSGAGSLRAIYDGGTRLQRGSESVEIRGDDAYLTNEPLFLMSYTADSLNRFNELFAKYNLDRGYDSDGVEKWIDFMWDEDDKKEFDNHLGEGCALERVEAESQSLSGDFDSNGCVGFSDFLAFSQIFGTEKKIISIGSTKKYNPLMDFDGDEKINFADFVAFSKVYGSGCEANQRSLDVNLLEGQPVQKKAVNCRDYSSEERRNECWIIRAGIEGDDSLCGNIVDSENEQNGKNLKSVCKQKANWKNYEVLINFADDPFPDSYSIEGFSVDESGIYVSLFEPHAGIEKYDFFGNSLGRVDTMPKNPLPFCGAPYCSVSPPAHISFVYEGQSYGYGYSPKLLKNDRALNNPPQLRNYEVKQVAVGDEVYVWIHQQIGKLKINRLGYDN